MVTLSDKCEVILELGRDVVAILGDEVQCRTLELVGGRQEFVVDGNKNNRSKGIMLPNLLAGLAASFFVTGEISMSRRKTLSTLGSGRLDSSLLTSVKELMFRSGIPSSV